MFLYFTNTSFKFLFYIYFFNLIFVGFYSSLFFSFIITESSSSPFSGQLLATAIQQRSLSTATGGGGFGGSGGGGGGSVINNNANCFYAATAPVTPSANLPLNANATATATLSSLPPAAISPTFIEHKYSANTFKEKFFANLRQQNSNKTKSLKTSNSIKKTEYDDSNETNSLRSLDIVATNEIGIGCGNVINNSDIDGGGGVENEVGVGGEGVNNNNNNSNSNNNINNHQTNMCSTIQQQLSENVKHNLYKKTIN